MKSWKGDYLNWISYDIGISTGYAGEGTEWVLENIADGKVQLKTCNSDCLHRPDKPQGVTTWHCGIGNEWNIEVVESQPTSSS